jgi:hypothetical protein
VLECRQCHACSTSFEHASPSRARAAARFPIRREEPAPVAATAGAARRLAGGSKRQHDADAQAQAQPGWRQHYEQLSPGAFEGLVQHVQLPGLRLVREDSSRALHQRGDLGSDAYGLALPLAQSAPAIFNGQRVGRDDSWWVAAMRSTWSRPSSSR